MVYDSFCEYTGYYVYSFIVYPKIYISVGVVHGLEWGARAGNRKRFIRFIAENRFLNKPENIYSKTAFKTQ